MDWRESMTGVRIVGIGGTLRAESTSEQALKYAVNAAAELGAETELIVATELDLPMYAPGRQLPAAAPCGCWTRSVARTA
ncbi:NADPH-dependent FMN reductase [Fodinicola feengrottensis]|uniref:NADPH-dependent FMN reductase n=1 Tax=Fodinicola feengrottensis TaxID=435914 RepID=UPI0028BE28FC|nr:NAD(P)H-dependent oxidoreductase [Fodinicola feengrottensis]